MHALRARRRASQQYRMNLPFTREAFFQVLANYNDAVWPMQLAALGAAMAAATLTTTRVAHRGRAVAALLAALWAWTGIVYQGSYFSAIHPAAPWFGAVFLFGALAFAWLGVRHDSLRFAGGPPFARGLGDVRSLAGWGLVIGALFVYPMIGVAMGHRFPASAAFGTPSATTIYTIGLLVLAGPTLPRLLWVAPLLWTVLGTLTALALGFTQDLMLPAAAAVALLVTGAASVPPHSASANP
jgi:hypothetical protein